jgi:V8-like Glu-specific endopeptidase
LYLDANQSKAIVKLHIQFEHDDREWAMASGWLVQPDVVVTAGHCAYNRGLGRAVKVKAYIGYNGKDSVNTSAVGFRMGVQIATTSGWLSAQASRESDVSFIKLKSAFTGTLNLINYTATPVTGSEKLGIVGYPADKKDNRGEAGAQTYEEWDDISYDIASNYMLEYNISTYEGI